MTEADGDHIATNLALGEVLQPSRQNIPIQRTTRRPHLTTQHLSNPPLLQNLLHLQQRWRKPSLDPNHRLRPAPFSSIRQLARALRVLRERPLDVHTLARLDARKSRVVVLIHARRDDDEVHVRVRGQVGGAAVGFCGGGEVVGFHCALRGFDARVAEGCDGVFGAAARGEEIGEVGA